MNRIVFDDDKQVCELHFYKILDKENKTVIKVYENEKATCINMQNCY